MFCVSPQSRPAMGELEFYTPLGRSARYVKSCFPNFLTVTQRGVYFPPPRRPDFDLYSLKWWSVIDVFAFAEKLRVSIAHPLRLIAQSLFGLAQIRPEYTSSPIQLNCLYTHGALASVCLEWLWHDGEFHPQPPPPVPLLYLTDNPTAVLWGWSCR